MDDGRFGWDVFCGVDDASDTDNDEEYQHEIINPITGEILYPTLTVLQYLLKEANIDTTIRKEWFVESIKARKDTRMLNLGFLNFSKVFGWDEVHVDDL